MIYDVHQFTVLLVIWQMLSGGSDVEAVKRHCGEISRRSKDQLMRDLTVGNSGFHWTFWLLPSLQKAAREQIPRANPSVTKMSRQTFLYGEYGRKCPKRNRPGVHVCPVHYVMQSDKNRIPENIVQVRCNCKHCFHDRSSTLFGKCEKVYAYTLVWRRSETNCEYRKYKESVAVACTCNIKNTRKFLAASD